MSTIFYTKEHEWIRVNEGSGVVGISVYASEQLGDIVFVELPNIGDTFSQNDVFGTVEAVKTVADLYIPVSGKVLSINDKLESNPELINSIDLLSDNNDALVVTSIVSKIFFDFA